MAGKQVESKQARDLLKRWKLATCLARMYSLADPVLSAYCGGKDCHDHYHHQQQQHQQTVLCHYSWS